MTSAAMNIHTLMQDQFDLAKVYAEDGAFRSAARILGDLTSSVTAHANWCDAIMAEMVARVSEEECPGHVASIMDPKICGRCGTHIDSLWPDDEGPDPKRKGALEAQHRDAVAGVERRFPNPYSTEAGLRGGLGRDDLGDPINLHGSGPTPIEPREG